MNGLQKFWGECRRFSSFLPFDESISGIVNRTWIQSESPFRPANHPLYSLFVSIASGCVGACATMYSDRSGVQWSDFEKAATDINYKGARNASLLLCQLDSAPDIWNNVSTNLFDVNSHQHFALSNSPILQWHFSIDLFYYLLFFKLNMTRRRQMRTNCWMSNVEASSITFYAETMNFKDAQWMTWLVKVYAMKNSKSKMCLGLHIDAKGPIKLNHHDSFFSPVTTSSDSFSQQFG